MMDWLPAAVYTTDAQGRLTYYNAAAARLWGREPELGAELWTGSWKMYEADGTVLDRERCPMAVAVRERRSVRGVEVIIERPNGDRRHVLPHPDPVLNDAGEVIGARNLLIDVTDLATVRAAAAESEERAGTVFEALPECVKVLAPDGTVTDMNAAGLRIVEAEGEEQVIGHSAYGLIMPDSLETFKRQHQQALDGQSSTAEFEIQGLKGTRRWMESRAVPLRRELGVITGVLSVTRDVSQRREAEIVARRLAAIVESSDDAILSKDLNGTIMSWNAAAERIFGFSAEEAVGQSIHMIIPADRRSEEDLILGRIRAGGRVDHFETKRKTKDGRLIDISLTVSSIRDPAGRVIGASKIARDISERTAINRRLAEHTSELRRAVELAKIEVERSSAAMRQSERLASLGTMSAGLGHDIGNLILPMRSHIDVLRATHGYDPLVADSCAALSRCADFFSSLVRGLRLFGRGNTDDSHGDTVDLSEWCEDILPLLRNLTGRAVTIHADIDEGLTPVVIGPGALTQAVTNIVKNCMDAFRSAGRLGLEVGAGPEDGSERPTITIRARPVVVGDETARVQLEVIDNGPGMDAEVLRHCMEPYFTTRVRGHQSGTGLGLALVHGVAVEAGGQLDITSAVGSGTTVRLVLPAGVKAGVGAARPRAVVRVANRAVAASVAAVLRSAGYEVSTVAEGGELDGTAALWVLEGLIGTERTQGNRTRTAVMLGNGGADCTLGADSWVVCGVSARPSPSELMGALRLIRGRVVEGGAG